MQEAMQSVAELFDMPINRDENRIPGANPTKKRIEDSQSSQPSLQVRNISKNDRIVMMSDMTAIVLYLPVLFISKPM